VPIPIDVAPPDEVMIGRPHAAEQVTPEIVAEAKTGSARPVAKSPAWRRSKFRGSAGPDRRIVARGL